MAETATTCEGLTEALREQRLLADVMHLKRYMQPDGSVPGSILNDVKANIFTAVQENAMPGAVTTTIQRVEYAENAAGRTQRIIKWLGKSAIEVAESGYSFHFSEVAHQRVDQEVAEARHSQEHLQAGVAQVFISPKMTECDASIEVARQENLADADAVRVSYAMTDGSGNIVARRMESLLVSNIPLSAWMAMLEDPDNLFGHAFVIRDKQASISIMELFKDMALSEEAIPNGPVALVKAVALYINDPDIRTDVLRQVQRFEHGQQLYRLQAERTAQEWLNFDIELARSLHTGRASLPIEAFISTLQHQWSDEDIRMIQEHEFGGRYIMSNRLAAKLEEAKQILLNGQAAVMTNNEKVLQQLPSKEAEKIQADSHFIEIARLNNAAAADIALLEARLARTMAYTLSRHTIAIGGGCSGQKIAAFRTGLEGNDDEIANIDTVDGQGSETAITWKWKRGMCRIEACASPKPTEVGPCSVCRNCQHMFDRGQDPTKLSKILGPLFETAMNTPQTPDISLYDRLRQRSETKKKLPDTKADKTPGTHENSYRSMPVMVGQTSSAPV